METNAAEVDYEYEFPPSCVTIYLDANALQPVVSTVVHELIHVVFSESFLNRVDETLEEVMVVALTEHMYRYISERKARLLRWSQLIEAKLTEYAATKPDKSIEVLVDRTERMEA